jgi:4-amino-4-deoxy-L-arabinose transferase-like glycosyltransferase
MSLRARAGALRGVPRAGWICALLAILNAACWSLITPPFQAPDEPSHFAYVQLLAETWRLPDSEHSDFSPQEQGILKGLHQREVQWHTEVHTISSGPALRELREDLTAPLSRVSFGGAGVAASEPPLYYAVETVPYYLGSSGTLLDQLELMRLLSALMAGLTALFAFLFVRESLPAAPWAWTVGGLAAALAPLLGFTSGVVTPDALLCAVCAAIFYCLARAFRRGLTRKLGATIGLLIAAGLLTKLNFIGVLPGVLLGLAVLASRGVRERPGAPGRRRALGAAAVALAIALVPACAYVLRNVLEGHATLGIASGALRALSRHGSPLGEIAYIWEFYLPRLPGMANHVPGLSTIRQLWFDRSVGLYGWLDTPFPVWVYNLALLPAALLAILGARTLLARRRALRGRLAELLVYLAMCVGLMVLIAAASRVSPRAEGAAWAQPRYLLPLLPLAAGALALAVRGAGRRWGPALGALIVVLFLAQDVFSQLQVLARFYG